MLAPASGMTLGDCYPWAPQHEMGTPALSDAET